MLSTRRSSTRHWISDSDQSLRLRLAAQGARRWCSGNRGSTPILVGQYAVVTVAFDENAGKFTHVRSATYDTHRAARATATRKRKIYTTHWTVTVHRGSDGILTVFDEQRRVVHTEPF